MKDEGISADTKLMVYKGLQRSTSSNQVPWQKNIVEHN